MTTVQGTILLESVCITHLNITICKSYGKHFTNMEEAEDSLNKEKIQFLFQYFCDHRNTNINVHVMLLVFAESIFI
jgi:hypothetical protein